MVIQVTDEKLERMLRAPLVRVSARRAVINMLVVVGMTVLLCWRKGFGPTGFVFWPVAAAAAMYVLVRIDYWRLKRAAMAPYRKLPDRGLTFRFTDEALEIGTIGNYSLCRWKDVRAVRRFRHAWCFYVGALLFVVVPVEAFDDKLASQVIQRLSAEGVTVR